MYILNTLIYGYMAVGKRINVSERIVDRELSNAGDMYYAVCFWRNARVRESMFRNFWMIILDNSKYRKFVFRAFIRKLRLYIYVG